MLAAADLESDGAGRYDYLCGDSANPWANYQVGSSLLILSKLKIISYEQHGSAGIDRRRIERPLQ